MADFLHVVARAPIWVRGKVAVNVDMTDGGCVKNDGTSVAGPKPVQLFLILGEGLGSEVVEELVVGIGSVDDLR